MTEAPRSQKPISRGSPPLTERSFIQRAHRYLGEASVQLSWEDGEPTSNTLKQVGPENALETERVQYLSQQFVDKLCSAEGLTDELLEEIERVIYQAHAPEDRLGTTSFRELLEIRTARGRATRNRHEEALALAGQQLNIERDRHDSLPTLRRHIESGLVEFPPGYTARTT